MSDSNSIYLAGFDGEYLPVAGFPYPPIAGTLTIEPSDSSNVPEPSTFVLFGSGAMVLLLASRRMVRRGV